MEDSAEVRMLEVQSALHEFSECILFLQAELDQLRAGKLDHHLAALVEAPPVPHQFGRVLQHCKFPEPPSLLPPQGPVKEAHPQVGVGSSITPSKDISALPNQAATLMVPALLPDNSVALTEEHAVIDSFDMDGEGVDDFFGAEGNYEELVGQICDEIDPASPLLAGTLQATTFPSNYGVGGVTESKNSSDEENHLPNQHSPDSKNLTREAGAHSTRLPAAVPMSNPVSDALHSQKKRRSNSISVKKKHQVI